MKKWTCIILAACLLTTFACDTGKKTDIGKVLGYKPIYSSDATLFTIQSQPAKPVSKAGKIYLKGNYIFQNEIGEGIHIIDNTNPANAQRVGFIKIKGSEELSIKGNYLYSNNFGDLVVADISNLADVKEVNRTKNAFLSANSQLVPPFGGTYFECVETSKGVVIGWLKDTIVNPKCSN